MKDQELHTKLLLDAIKENGGSIDKAQAMKTLKHLFLYNHSRQTDMVLSHLCRAEVLQEKRGTYEKYKPKKQPKQMTLL